MTTEVKCDKCPRCGEELTREKYEVCNKCQGWRVKDPPKRKRKKRGDK